MYNLTGKTAIITGASSGIGYATATLLARYGVNVIATARRENALRKLVNAIEESGGTARSITADVTKETDHQKIVEFARAEFGRIDITVNNAGTIGGLTPIKDLTTDSWRQTLETNLSAMFYAAKAQVPVLLERGGGSLIFVGSFVGTTKAFPNMADYAASKAGVVGLAKSLALELGENDIRVNAILPGGTDTPMNIANNPGSGPEVMEYLNSIHLLKRLATPEEIAKAIVFLASDAASFVTGSAMLVDGGVSISS